jgi:hypothetical protein
MAKNNFPIFHCSRHTREGGYPVRPAHGWIPAFAGMTIEPLFLGTF